MKSVIGDAFSPFLSFNYNELEFAKDAIREQPIWLYSLSEIATLWCTPHIPMVLLAVKMQAWSMYFVSYLYLTELNHTAQ